MARLNLHPTDEQIVTLAEDGLPVQHCISIMDGPTYDEYGHTKYVGRCHCGQPFVGKGRTIREAWDEAQKYFDEHIFKVSDTVGKSERDEEPRTYSYLGKFKTFSFPFRSRKLSGNSR